MNDWQALDRFLQTDPRVTQPAIPAAEPRPPLGRLNHAEHKGCPKGTVSSRGTLRTSA